MPAKVRSRLSYSNVMATVAVFIALGGTSYAVATGSIGSREIHNNSVRSKDLRNNDVRGRDVRNATIGTRDVANGGLLAVDFRAGQLPAGERGEQGPPGQAATNLFAYISDTGPAASASVQYGRGVTGVTEPAVIGNPYAVTFDRGLANCVVSATPGRGDPNGGGAFHHAIPQISMAGDSVTLSWENDAGTLEDTSFMIAAFC
jgi:hypothetical protein